MSKRRTLEHSEQVAVIQWCRLMANAYPELHWIYAIPNGAKLSYIRSRSGKRFSPQAIILLQEGLLPGASDLVLPCARRGFHSLYIELKVKPNKPTPEQQEFIAAMNQLGNLAVVCYGADEAIQQIADYLGIDMVSYA